MTLAARARIILPLVALAILLGLSVATQDLAAIFHYPRDFGRGLADLGPCDFIRLGPSWAGTRTLSARIPAQSTKRPCGGSWRLWRPC